MGFGLLWLLLGHAVTMSLAGGLALHQGDWIGAGGGWCLWPLGSWTFWGPMVRGVLFPYDSAFATGEDGIVPFLLTYLPTLLMPLWLSILGTTFARARVRRIHLLRGLAYGLPAAVSGALALLLGLNGEVVLLTHGLSPIPEPVLMWGTGAMPLAFLIYHGLWWWLLIRRYLRLPHAIWIVVLNTIMSWLVLVILGALLGASNQGS